MMQGLNRVHIGSASGRVKSEHDPGCQAQGHGDDDRGQRPGDLPIGKALNGQGQGKAKNNPQHCAKPGNGDAFDQKLLANIFAFGAH